MAYDMVVTKFFFIAQYCCIIDGMTPSYVKFNWDFIFRSELCALHIWQTHNNRNKVTFKITNKYRVVETHTPANN